MKRVTLVLAADLHESLRQEAFRKRVSMGHLIRTRLDRGLRERVARRRRQAARRKR